MAKIRHPSLNRSKSIRERDGSENSTNLLHPAFSFKHLSIANHSLQKCEVAEKVALVERLAELGKLTWQEIQTSARHGLGHETIPKNQIKVGLPPCITDDVTLLSFRFDGKKPMVGFRKDKIFYIIWLDRDFSLYVH